MAPSPLSDVTLRLVENLEDALELKRWLGERRDVLGVDTETEGLDPFRHDLRLVQVGDLKTGWSLPWPAWSGFTQEILREYQGEMVAHNCFSGDTEYITSQGVRTFTETSGSVQEVWTEKGWHKALIRCYGEAPTVEIALRPYNRSRSFVQHLIRATANHRWMCRRKYLEQHHEIRQWAKSNGYSVKASGRIPDAIVSLWLKAHPTRNYVSDGWESFIARTDELYTGDRIAAQIPLLEPDTYSDGFRHGLILADGSKNSFSSQTMDQGYQIRLCGWKEIFKDRFETYTYPPSAEGDPVVNKYRPVNGYDLKSVPPDDTDLQYLCDFIAGWAALDSGSNSDSHSRIVYTTKKVNADWLCHMAPSAGWYVTGISQQSMKGLQWARASFCYAVVLSRGDPEISWTVESVDDSRETELVYCAEVPGIDRFTLGPGIYTSNSSFDWRFLYHRGDIELPWHHLHDSMILAALDDPTRAKGLKPLSALLIDKYATAGERALHEGMHQNGWDWRTVPVRYPAYWLRYSAHMRP